MKSQKWYDAIRAANSKPKTDEHKAKIAASKKGQSVVFSNPDERTRKIAETRQARIEQGGCENCGSLKHTIAEHNERLAQGRRDSAKWRDAVAAANTANKKGKPIHFSDPAARRQNLRIAANRPETRELVSKARNRMWTNRSEEQRRALGEKISKAQKGKTLSSEHLANLRKANSAPRSEEHKRKLGLAHIGKPAWNKGLTKFTNASVMSNAQKHAGRVPDYNKYRAHYEGPKGRLLMRSRWEVAYAGYLDRNNIEWQYEPRWFNVGGGEWTGAAYTPDFYLPSSNEYIEIKGRMTEENIRKMKRFTELFPEVKLTVLKRAELVSIGLVDRHGRLIDTDGKVIRRNGDN